MPTPSLVIFKFKIGHYNGSMGLNFFNKDILIKEIPSFTETEFVITENIEFPTTIYFDVFGKDKFDTDVDENNNILADKYIQLTDLIVDKAPIHILSLIKLCKLETNDKILYNNYWGFNGRVTINFEEVNSFLWHMKHLKNVDE